MQVNSCTGVVRYKIQRVHKLVIIELLPSAKRISDDAVCRNERVRLLNGNTESIERFLVDAGPSINPWAVVVRPDNVVCKPLVAFVL